MSAANYNPFLISTIGAHHHHRPSEIRFESKLNFRLFSASYHFPISDPCRTSPANVRVVSQWNHARQPVLRNQFNDTAAATKNRGYTRHYDSATNVLTQLDLNCLSVGEHFLEN